MSATTQKFPPTAEQAEAQRLFATGENLAIEAGAGTGKTSTLVLLAESTDRRGQYVAFNRAIVNEAKTRFPGNVNCSTAHSLAFREVGKRFKSRIDDRRRMRSSEIADRLGIDPRVVESFTGERKRLSPSKLAGIARATVLAYCQSGDAEIDRRHVPYQRGIDAPWSGRRGAGNRAIADAVLPAARAIWADATDVHGTLPYDHAYYLKLWERSNPRIAADFILFDEAQDASPVMLSIVEQQTRAQLVFVGDSQQQIYSFTGAVNALGRIREGGGNVAFLTRSFRFGEAVAAAANVVLDALDAELRIVGYGRIASVVERVADPDVVLTRTNAEAVREVLDAIDRDLTVHLVGGGREIIDFAKGAAALQCGESTDHPDLWLFENWAQVVAFVEEDEQGGDLRLLVRLVDEFGADRIIAALERGAREEDADLVVSTAHKAKGREWNRVRLAADFPADPQDEELRLLYVAVTRAKFALDVTAIEFYAEGAAPAAPSDPEDETGDETPTGTPEGESGPEAAPETASRDEVADAEAAYRAAERAIREGDHSERAYDRLDETRKRFARALAERRANAASVSASVSRLRRDHGFVPFAGEAVA